MHCANSQCVIGVRDLIHSGSAETGVTASLSGSAATPILIGIRLWFCLLALAVSAAATSSVRISLTPLSAALTASQTQPFTAKVTGTANIGVTWSLSHAVGTISSTGVYTAPASIASEQKITVKATSRADSTKSASAAISLKPVTVTLTPSSASLTISQSQQFTATVTGTANSGVTWSLSSAVGTVSSSGVYTAPASIASPQTVTVTTTSVADSSKTATAVITLLQTITVSLSPYTVSLAPSDTQQFTPTVSGTSDTAVTWSLSPSVGAISSAGLYTAPSSILTPQAVTVTAQSVADPTKSANAAINLSPPTGTFTYYVDSVNGSDSNPGTLANPWQTIAKVNSTTLLPGQSVAFKSGGVWRETLTPSSSGSSGNPITFSSYGDGALPIFNGADLLTSWTYNPVSVSGSVTQANMKMSLAASRAFVDFSTPGELTPYSGDEITITDSSGHQLIGYISAVGTGETYGSQLLPDPGMDAIGDFTSLNATGAILTSGCQAGQCLQVTPTSGYGRVNQAFAVSSGMLLYTSAYVMKGTDGAWVWLALANHALTQLRSLTIQGAPPSWTNYSLYGTADSASTSFYQQYEGDTTGTTTLYDTASVTQVLAPSATGVTITSTEGGATYNWTSEASGFNRNDSNGYTYSIAGVSPLYYAPKPPAPSQGSFQLFEDATRLSQETLGTSSLTPGQWYLDTQNSRIWVYTFAGDSPSNHTMEISVRPFAITNNSMDYIAVRSLTAQNAAWAGVDFENYYFTIHSISIAGMTAQNNYGDGIAVYDDGSRHPIGNVSISGNTTSGNGGPGIDLWTVGASITNVSITGNVGHDDVWNPVAAPNSPNGEIHVLGPTVAGLTITNNLAYNSGSSLPNFKAYPNLYDIGSGIYVDTVPSGLVIAYNEVYK
jgi:hypothetical protein